MKKVSQNLQRNHCGDRFIQTWMALARGGPFMCIKTRPFCRTSLGQRRQARSKEGNPDVEERKCQRSRDKEGCAHKRTKPEDGALCITELCGDGSH